LAFVINLTSILSTGEEVVWLLFLDLNSILQERKKYGFCFFIPHLDPLHRRGSSLAFVFNLNSILQGRKNEWFSFYTSPLSSPQERKMNGASLNDKKVYEKIQKKPMGYHWLFS